MGAFGSTKFLAGFVTFVQNILNSKIFMVYYAKREKEAIWHHCSASNALVFIYASAEPATLTNLFATKDKNVLLD